MKTKLKRLTARPPPSARRLRDEHLTQGIRRIRETNCSVYGSRKSHTTLVRARHQVARRTVERLMPRFPPH
ncbi:IS3 family transposase [Streptomyces lavendulae]|uniref:IS3 family transposase n=1 Tax=Streptomyces lavendulae TaxID=1914 RepID=UPI0033CECE97